MKTICCICIITLLFLFFPSNISHSVLILIPNTYFYYLRAQASASTPVPDELASDSKSTWIDENVPELIGKTIAVVTMECHIPELPEYLKEALTRGGLGIFSGDLAEGLNDIGIFAFGVVPLYGKRMRQRIKWEYGIPQQDIYYPDGFTDEVLESLVKQGILESVVNDEGEEPDIIVEAWDELDPRRPDRNKLYPVKFFKINRAGTPFYLAFCKDVLDVLYTGESKIHRITHEIVFSQALAKLIDWFIDNGYKADGKNRLRQVDILHVNEDHLADAAAIIRANPRYRETAIVYTNHTVVEAGLEEAKTVPGSPDKSFLPVSLERAYDEVMFDHLPVDQGAVKAQKRYFVHGDKIAFSKGILGICDVCNAVSADHAKITKDLFREVYSKPIVPVLNGSGKFWVMDEILELQREGKIFDPNSLDNRKLLWKLHNIGKDRAFNIIEERIRETLQRAVRLDRRRPTVWLARRFVEYKNIYPMLKDITHVICANRGEKVQTRWGEFEGLGMQVVVSGIAPKFSQEEWWVSEFVKWMDRPDLMGRFFYVPDCDTKILKAQAIGNDLCANVPLKEQEACGTSGGRAGRNGGVNTYTGTGESEYLEEVNEKTGEGSGFALGPITIDSNSTGYTPEPEKRTWRELYLTRSCGDSPKEFLEVLTKATRMYYAFTDSEGTDNEDTRWLRVMVNSLNDTNEKATADAMAERYAKDVYPLSIERRMEDLGQNSIIAPLNHAKEAFKALESSA